MKRTEEQYNEYITIIIEKSTGRADITLKEPDGNSYYYAEKNGSKWELKFCENGFCYNATLVDTCKTLKECIEIIRDVCKDLTDHYRAVEDSLAHYRAYKGYTITGTENTGFVALAPYGYYSGKVYKTEEEAIADIEKDISESVSTEEPTEEPIEEPTEEPTEETDSFELTVENEKFVAALDKMHEIVANPLIDLNDVIRQLKSSLISNYGEQAVKQVIDAKNDTIRTELTGFHVSGVITETGIMMLSCDIYAQDLDIKESYLAYNVGGGYAVYDEISLTRIDIYADADVVKQFFVNRVKALEAETIKTLY